ncbi:Methyl-accepting chemotaxis protein [Moritella sp. JT01]|uniref:hypothetical protein n=1 Tax=Moritella sp. JT01 TaxID=756698 RepID=UPI00079255CE|nr:hypothetical protein [Moritella sp. JT01]KXO06581.1 Methyl-accepting chemotaxis protein [Moritella sp. JT01]
MIDLKIFIESTHQFLNNCSDLMMEITEQSNEAVNKIAVMESQILNINALVDKLKVAAEQLKQQSLKVQNKTISTGSMDEGEIELF